MNASRFLLGLSPNVYTRGVFHAGAPDWLTRPVEFAPSIRQRNISHRGRLSSPAQTPAISNESTRIDSADVFCVANAVPRMTSLSVFTIFRMRLLTSLSMRIVM